MKIKLGPKTIDIPDIRSTISFHIPPISIANFRIPLPTVSPWRWLSLRIGGTKSAFAMIAFVIVGFAATMFLVAESTSSEMVWPEPGARYDLSQSMVGQKLEPDPGTPSVRSQTLEVRLAAGARINGLTFSGLQLGKTGLTDCISIERDGSSTGYLSVDTVVISNLVAPTLDLATSFVYNLSLSGDVDGHTTGATLNSTTPDIVVASTRGAGSFSSTSGVVDRILITLVGDATVKSLTIEDTKCSVGGVDLDFIKAGSLTMSGLEIGDDGDINTAAAEIQASVEYFNLTDNLIDKPIVVK